MVDISTTAATEIKRLQSSRYKESAILPLRLAVKPGGCSGFYYELSLAHDVAAGESSDRTINVQDITLIVDSDSCQYIEELKIDYSEDLMGGGFRFHNSQAQTVCGCGASFAFKEDTVNS